jgi:hypothetical protein
VLLAVSKDDLMAFISLNSLEVKPKAFDQKQQTFIIVSARGSKGKLLCGQW